jgi:phospholipid/cholesterol/gamma-HCH transport system substrate-binding protein
MFDMQKQLRWSKLRVGLVITLALLTLFITVFFAGNIEDILAPKVELKAQIQDAKGLRKGAPVWISGTEVGAVNRIELNPAYGTIVTISVKESALPFIRKDSQATVLTMGLLGDKYIELTIGSSQAGQVSPGEMLKGATQIELQDVVETSARSIEKMTEFVKRLDSLAEKIEKGGGTIGRLVNDPAIYDNLRDTTKTLSQVLEDIKKSQGTLKKLLEDPALYNKMLSASSSLEDFSKTLNQSSGTLKKLAEDPQLYDNLNKATQKLSSILEKVDKGEGVAGALLKDEELVRELKETIRELKELTKDIKEHPKKYFKFSLF